MKNSASAFTLVELLLVPTLMGLLAGIYIVYRPSTSLKQYTRSLSLTLEALSIAAITFEDTITLTVESNSYTVSRAKLPTIAEKHVLPDRIRFENTPQTITLYPAASCSPQTISLSSAGSRCTLTTSLRCRISHQCQ